MKILGKWWTGLRCLCRECGEQFALEADDIPRHGERYFVEVACPTCGEPVQVSKPYDAEVPHR